MLDLDAIDVRYGEIEALRGLTLHVYSGEIVSVLGNNGAGKTTTLSMISGLVRPKSGTATFDGIDLAKCAPWDIVARGVVHVPEGRRLFGTMTVAENLQIGGYLVNDGREIARRVDEVYELIPTLSERRAQKGGTLSGGEQQLVAIGRALVARPRLLMLDEPSMGLAPLMVKAVMQVIKDVNDSGTTVLLVEQNARAALRIAHRAYVLESGTQTVEGAANDLAKDSRIVEAYLGG